MYIRMVQVAALLLLGACATPEAFKAAGAAADQAKQFNAKTGLPVDMSVTKTSAPFMGIVAFTKVEYSVWTNGGYQNASFTGVQGDGSSYQTYRKPFEPDVWYVRGPNNKEHRIQ